MSFSNSAAQAALFNWSMKQRGSDWLWMLLACYAAGFGLTLALAWPTDGLTRASFLLLMAIMPPVIAAFVFLPAGVLVIGLIRIKLRSAETTELDDSLAATSPEQAERKLREFIALKQGLGARIGMGESVQPFDAERATYTLPDDDPRDLPH
jgi:hypothetical protein